MDTYIYPSLKEIDLEIESVIASSLDSGIGAITEEPGEWS